MVKIRTMIIRRRNELCMIIIINYLIAESTEKMINEFKRLGGDDVVTTYDFMVISNILQNYL